MVSFLKGIPKTGSFPPRIDSSFLPHQAPPDSPSHLPHRRRRGAALPRDQGEERRCLSGDDGRHAWQAVGGRGLGDVFLGVTPTRDSICLGTFGVFEVVITCCEHVFFEVRHSESKPGVCLC